MKGTDLVAVIFELSFPTFIRTLKLVFLTAPVAALGDKCEKWGKRGATQGTRGKVFVGSVRHAASDAIFAAVFLEYERRTGFA